MPVLPEGCYIPAEALLNGETIRLEATLPVWLRELIQKMLQLEREDRPTIAKVYECLKEEKAPEKMKSVFHQARL